MSAFLALVRKDVRLFMTNRRALLVSLVTPVLISGFFGAVMGGGPSKPEAVPIGVVDLDQSAVSRRIVAEMAKDTTFALQQLAEPMAIERVRKGELRAAAVIPAHFGDQAGDALFRTDQPKPEIVVHYDPSQQMVLALVKGVLTQHVMQAVSAAAFGGDGGAALARARTAVTDSKDLDPKLRLQLLDMFGSIEKVQQRRTDASGAGTVSQGLSVPFATREHEVLSGQRHYNSYDHAFAGMSVQFILLSGVELGVGLLLMRRLGLWQRLRAAPISRATVLGSRLVAGAIIALFLMIGIFAAAMLFFGLRIEGSVAGFAAVAVAFALMTSSFGLLLASAGRTPEATRGIAILVTLLLVMLGGAWVPTFVFPGWLQSITRFVPTRWAVDGFDAMTWRGQGFDAVLWPVLAMLALSAVLGTLAVRWFRWEE